MIHCYKNSMYHDTVNSSQEELGAGAEFTGEWVRLDNFVKILVTVNTDQVSANLGLVAEFTADPTADPVDVTSDARTVSFNVATGLFGGTYVFNVPKSFYRIRYINGATAQSYFLVQSILKKIVDGEQITTPLSVIKTQQTSNAVRIVSDLKKDIAMGLVEYNKNFNVNGTRFQGVTDNETILTSITSETYQWPTSAQRVRVKAGGSTSDIVYGSGAKAVMVYGLDSNYDEISEVLYTAGASASAWTTKTFLRVNSVVTVASGSLKTNAGLLVIENESDHFELSAMCPGFGRALSCVFTTSRQYSCVISRIMFMADSDHSVTFRGYFRDYATGTNYIINAMPGLRGPVESTQQNYIKFNPRTDFWATAQRISGSGPAEVSIVYELDLLVTG